MLRRIDRILLRVPSIESAVRYYRDALGLALLRQERFVASLVMADGVTELVLRADPDQPADEIYYLVDDVRDLYRRREKLQLKFFQPPQQVGRGYKAAVKDPFGNVLLLLDRTCESGSSSVEDASAPAALFAGVEPPVPARKELLIKLYQEVGRTADDLPYTPQFEKLFTQYISSQREPKPTRRETWRHLLNLRKGENCRAWEKARSESPAISKEQEQTLRELLGEEIGRRDRLPYTDKFDQLVDEFNKTQARPISPHLVWRLVAKLAK